MPEDYVERLRLIVDQSWAIFTSQFIGCRHEIRTEAPFQHHLANILATVGSLHCTARSDQFIVDLERRVPNINGRTKCIDITCEFANTNASCAIELKFKTARQGAQDHGRIDAYIDIASVEQVCESSFTFGRFYMITDSRTYINKSSRGVGTVFRLDDGCQIAPDQRIEYPLSKGREHVSLVLKAPYRLEWHSWGDWYFLEIPIGH